MKHHPLTALMAVVCFALSAGCQSAALNAAPSTASNEFATSDDLYFESDGVQLAATLLTPVAPNGLGVVMLPGSGPAERAIIRPAAAQLAKTGAVVLIFDKRGSGQSGGDWQKASLDELAHDAMAAMALLRDRPTVVNVGLWAHSQGNWVATRAGELGAQPGFLIAVSGGGVSPRETERYGYQHRVASASPADQTLAMAFVASYFDYLSGAISRNDLDALISDAKTTDWYAKLDIENVLVSETYRAKWSWVADYDPARLASNRKFPTLVLLGGGDHSIPLDLTIADWNRQLAIDATIGNRITIFAGRDHHLRIAGAGHGHGVTTEPAIWRVIDHWLGEEVKKY